MEVEQQEQPETETKKIVGDRDEKNQMLTLRFIYSLVLLNRERQIIHCF